MFLCLKKLPQDVHSEPRRHELVENPEFSHYCQTSGLAASDVPTSFDKDPFCSYALIILCSIVSKDGYK